MRTGHAPAAHVALAILLSLAGESAPCRPVLPSRAFRYCSDGGVPWYEKYTIM